MVGLDVEFLVFTFGHGLHQWDSSLEAAAAVHLSFGDLQALSVRAGRHVGRTLAGSIRRAGKLYRARSRLYRSHILQVNMRSKALAEIYRMHSFVARRCSW